MNKQMYDDRYKNFAKLYKSFHSFGLIPTEICKVLCKIFNINRTSYYNYLRKCRDIGYIETTYEGERERKHQRMLNKDNIKPDEDICKILEEFVGDVPSLEVCADIDELVNLDEPKNVTCKVNDMSGDTMEVNALVKPNNMSNGNSLFDGGVKNINYPLFSSNTPTIIDECWSICYSELPQSSLNHYIGDDMYLLNYGLYTYFTDISTKSHVETDIQKFVEKIIDKSVNGPYMTFNSMIQPDVKEDDKKYEIDTKNFVVLRLVKAENDIIRSRIEEIETEFEKDGITVSMITDYYNDFSNISDKIAMSKNTIDYYMKDNEYEVCLIIADDLYSVSQLFDLKKAFKIYEKTTIVALMRTNKRAFNMFKKVILNGEEYNISRCKKYLNKVKMVLEICDRAMIAVSDGCKSISTEIKLMK